MLSISSQVEYVSDLGLWFSMSRKDHLPCISDLSSTLNGHQPELRCKWECRFLVGYPLARMGRQGGGGRAGLLTEGEG
jgi:hypothetical protein